MKSIQIYSMWVARTYAGARQQKKITAKKNIYGD